MNCRRCTYLGAYKLIRYEEICVVVYIIASLLLCEQPSFE